MKRLHILVQEIDETEKIVDDRMVAYLINYKKGVENIIKKLQKESYLHLCYDEKGRMCWQISNRLPFPITSKKQMPYVEFQIAEEKLYATDFLGREFNVDIENGELLDVKIVH